jgi:hypothetical protein
MNSISETAVTAFSGNENKALLWSVLHGGGKFVGIPDSQVPTIKEIFEQTIHNMSEHCRRLNQPINLNAINKEAVVIICKKIEAIKIQQQQQQQSYQNPPQQSYQKKQQQVPQLETIYRAEDMQKERQNAFQNEFKRKEEEMSSILKLKKPEEINFTDDVYDKPIGDDMERLLAEALASRERELEQIKNVFTPESNSSNVGSNLNANKNKEQFVTYNIANAERSVVNEKRVSFGNELHVIKNENDENDENDGNDGNDVSFIFSKLKKIKTRKDVLDENVANEYNAAAAMTSADDTILQMSQDITYIKTTLAEIVMKLNNLCNHESSLPPLP